ncbi:hypothetical protein A2382_04720 [Candidatus Woesebacteria bacterium RIFOXYB1_FULL_38_16]|uniref:Uncharacterized protein n=1 Tax=Candidatus Woesebacteria bacterium RIFOXYB1_FULL_38_16 TaxID=1802538 RepID=A0A1F8CUK4_9BACT|nr:MAG: hypothetical protein A2191_02200 [Candidatus Woesebacteria bacterium RIFOXYA1_FULL_38_9]OGM79962.1 MAG: hypothetical protein A2382_04720 [Candidatus Woesebacteria bacterium RIFOXYB1_FULL_38_16]
MVGRVAPASGSWDTGEVVAVGTGVAVGFMVARGVAVGFIVGLVVGLGVVVAKARGDGLVKLSVASPRVKTRGSQAVLTSEESSTAAVLRGGMVDGGR